MKADAAAQRRLLDLQAVDTALAQLDHRRSHLPETARARALQADRARAAETVIEADTIVSDLEIEQSRAEADLVPVRERLTRDEQRVADGSVTDPRALQGLLDEIQHLRRRISDLEDAQLEAMERLDEARGRSAEVASAKKAVEDDMRKVLSIREARLTEIARERGQLEAERDALGASLPADLLALYGRIAEKAGGVGAAELRGGRCGGCQLEANSADLTRYESAPADLVLRCEECNRILVRTGSGS